MGAISGTCSEFGVVQPHSKAKRVVDPIKIWRAADGEDSAKPFEVDTDMPQIYASMWELERMTKPAKIQAWTQFLISFVIMARASCVTEYCPTVEDILLPEADTQWDPDGLPKYIDIGMRDWKMRTPAHSGKRYGMCAQALVTPFTTSCVCCGENRSSPARFRAWQACPPQLPRRPILPGDVASDMAQPVRNHLRAHLPAAGCGREAYGQSAERDDLAEYDSEDLHRRGPVSPRQQEG
jgi:hypothetical protein